ncbi:hypothetical protein LASUN_19100 [Lentilactobacillus sunkii]|jgi:hypothetical protein|uniref:Uncharacterized protein n=1 Tax=Lentilactobacillus sunkii TaxID=481719 RepID=A0A1E7XB87_9LACO|nr:hypothetical protein LASUN_19100 [Lentilactobacillus sunkii]
MSACEYLFSRNVGVIIFFSTRKMGYILTKLVITFAIITVFDLSGMSLSTKNAIRTRMIIDGRPMSAIKCNPKHRKDGCRALSDNVYTISSKYAYKVGSTEIFQFKVNSSWIFIMRRLLMI